jgi:DNA-binding response OmpR family regulator
MTSHLDENAQFPHGRAMRVLLVEDSLALADSIRDFLEARGYIVDHEVSGERGLERALRTPYDALVIDVMLPGGIGGFALCRRIRASDRADTPVLLLTALDALDNKLAGFEAGADDYCTKPLSLHELLARLRALIGRRRRGETLLVVGGLVLDLGRQEAVRDGRSLVLTESALKLLAEMMRKSPNVVAREHLERLLWPRQTPASDALKTHMYYLRRELDHEDEQPMLVTVRGRGYRLADPR